LSDVYFNNTIKLLDLENSLFGAGFVALSHVLAEF